MTTIAWTSETWNPIRAVNRITGKVGWYCQKVSPGCKNCYAQAMNRYRGNGRKYDVAGAENLHIGISVDALEKPLKWKKGRRVFVCSMTDLFLEQHTDEMIDQVFAVMALASQHTFQVLTKRPERMQEYLAGWSEGGMTRVDVLKNEGERYALATGRGSIIDIETSEGTRPWPLPNVWLGVSAEDQQRAEERIPFLLETPAAVRWVSYEPALGPINFEKIGKFRNEDLSALEECVGHVERAKLDWVVVGGESGPGARPFTPGWAMDVINQCRPIGMETKVFVKQMGSVIAKRDGYKNSKGEDPSEWPEQLRVREYPRTKELVG